MKKKPLLIQQQTEGLAEIFKDLAQVSLASIFIETFFQPLFNPYMSLTGFLITSISWYYHLVLIKKSHQKHHEH